MVSKKISLMALFTAFAVILSYIETFIPTVGIPGAKLGLANFAVIRLCMLLETKKLFLLMLYEL